MRNRSSSTNNLINDNGGGANQKTGRGASSGVNLGLLTSNTNNGLGGDEDLEREDMSNMEHMAMLEAKED